MDIGINTNWVKNYDSPKYFVNLARHLKYWKGDCIQKYGKVYPSNVNEIVNNSIVDTNAGVQVESGKYVIEWKGDGQISIKGGDFKEPGKFTINYSGTSQLDIRFKGRALEHLSIIHVDYINNRSEWHPKYIEYIKSLNVSVIRAMNWSQASETLEKDWGDRVLQSDISYQMGVPLETMLDFANEVNKNIWWCIPPMVNDEYVTNAAHIIKNKLNSSLMLYVELGNEIWNSADPWGNGTSWVSNLTEDKLTATVISNGVFEKQLHNLTTGQEIVSFQTLYNKQNDIRLDWKYSIGITLAVHVIDENTFALKYNGDFLETAENQSTLYYCNKNNNLSVNYSELSERYWNILQSIIPRQQMHFTLASQYNNPWLTGERYKYIIDKGNVDSISIAPYYNIENVEIVEFEQMANMEREVFPHKILQHKLPNVDLICYEGGPHYSMKLSSDKIEWLYDYWKSSECESVIHDYLKYLSDYDISLFCYYKDASITRFGLCEDISNPTIDGRYRGFVYGRGVEPPLVEPPLKYKIKINAEIDIEISKVL